MKKLKMYAAFVIVYTIVYAIINQIMDRTENQFQ